MCIINNHALIKKYAGSSQGFTLVEMMVAVVLSVILSLGVGYFIHASLYSVQDVKTLQLMESAANIFYLMKEDIISSTSVDVPDSNTLSLSGVTYSLSSNQLLRDGVNLLPSWNNGGIYAVAVAGNPPFREGIDVDGDGSTFNGEGNMAKVSFDLKCMNNGREIRKIFFTLEALCDADSNGRFK
jgi:prepilin-type N-terminal cleavage/methylation domain-containing protein